MIDLKARASLAATCVVAVALSVWLGACGERKPADFDLTEAGVKSLDPDVTSVSITDQIDGQTKYVDMTVTTKVLWGGQSDWNSVASSSHRLMSELLRKPEVSRARVVYRSAENKLDWAQVSVARTELPANWQALTYLQFFAVAKPVSGSIEAGRWLCDFYGKYSSANPPGTEHLMYCRD